MPKLPPNYVKSPKQTSPKRPTTIPPAISARELVLRLDEVTWQAVQAASEREGVTAETVLRRALDRFLAAPVSAATTSDAQHPSARAQLFDQFCEQFAHRRWLQCLSTLAALLREARASGHMQPA